jgi:integrase
VKCFAPLRPPIAEYGVGHLRIESSECFFPRGKRENQSPFAVRQLTLTTGECLPILVRKSDWIPLRIPMRWTVTRRRFECMENTLSNDLRSIGLLYEIARIRFNVDLDESLERCEILPNRELDQLAACVRDGNGLDAAAPKSLSTTSTCLCSMRNFLKWAANPSNQGMRLKKPAIKISADIERIDLVFRPFEGTAMAGERIRPLEPDELTRIWSLTGPTRDSENRILLPIRFSIENPFWPENRLRNWLMMTASHQCSHRRGELLKTCKDDVPKMVGEALMILRRPHDRLDTRTYKPRVKTVERGVPDSDELRAGLREYLTGSSPWARPKCKTPYLFVTAAGNPLSITAADAILRVVARHTHIDDLSWHSFRHTWAEEVAEELFSQGVEEERAVQMLRELGGWKKGSDTPFHYIQKAIHKDAYRFLAERNRKLYGPRKTDEREETAD